MITAKSLIEKYQLLPHPEGGYFKETYRSEEYIAHQALPSRFTDKRNFSTAIYFLLEQGNFSAFHKIKSDECWHFYAGEALLVYVLHY
jgi:predicted cupin superfamily sugar epimerase